MGSCPHALCLCFLRGHSGCHKDFAPISSTREGATPGCNLGISPLGSRDPFISGIWGCTSRNSGVCTWQLHSPCLGAADLPRLALAEQLLLQIFSQFWNLMLRWEDLATASASRRGDTVPSHTSCSEAFCRSWWQRPSSGRCPKPFGTGTWLSESGCDHRGDTGSICLCPRAGKASIVPLQRHLRSLQAETKPLLLAAIAGGWRRSCWGSTVLLPAWEKVEQRRELG